MKRWWWAVLAAAGLLGSSGPVHAQLIRTYTGETVGDGFGFRVVNAGDLDGDAVEDLIVSAFLHTGPLGSDQGKLYLYAGADGSLIDTIDGPEASSWFGTGLSASRDINFDGVHDIFVGAPLGNHVYLYDGATRTLLASAPGEGGGVGFDVEMIGDLDGDAIPDGLVSAPNYGTTGNNGRIYAPSTATALPIYTITGAGGGPPSYGESLGTDMAPIGDVDGDGVEDFVAGAAAYSLPLPSDGYEGRAYIYSGVDGTQITFFQGSDSYTYLGSAVAGLGDLQGDGYADVLIGAPGRSIVELRSSAPGWPLLPLVGDTGEMFGAAVAGLGDVSGNGRPDFAVGAPLRDGAAGTAAGRVTVYYGRTAYPMATLDGSSAFEHFGTTIARAGDLTGDGRQEVAIATTGTGAISAGEVRIYAITPPCGACAALPGSSSGTAAATILANLAMILAPLAIVRRRLRR